MCIRKTHRFTLAMALLLSVGVAAWAQPARVGQPPLEVSELVYTGATVQTQVDVNGAAAVMLLGSALDGLVATAQEQAKAQAAGQRPALPIPPQVYAALPVLAPVRDFIKSVDHVTMLKMTVSEPVSSSQFLHHYGRVLAPRGWVSLLTVQDRSGPTVAAMVAPGGKGLFVALNDQKQKQLVMALATTNRPIGDMVAQVVQAAAEAAPKLVNGMMGGKHGGPPPAKAIAPPTPEGPAAPAAPPAPPASK